MTTTKAFLSTCCDMWLVPIPMYGLFAVLGWLEMPDVANSLSFYLSASVIKAGFAFGFVGFFSRTGSWQRYALTGWVMFAALELGQVVSQTNPLSSR